MSKQFIPLQKRRLPRRVTLNSYVLIQKYGLAVGRAVVVDRLVRIWKFLFIINWFDQEAIAFGRFCTYVSL